MNSFEVSNVSFIDLETNEKIGELNNIKPLEITQEEKERHEHFNNFLQEGLTLTLEDCRVDESLLNAIKPDEDPEYIAQASSPKLNKLISIYNRTKKKRIKKKLAKRVAKLDHWIYYHDLKLKKSQIKFK